MDRHDPRQKRPGRAVARAAQRPGAWTLAAGAVCAGLSGCSFGPAGTPPAMPQPEHYTAEPLGAAAPQARQAGQTAPRLVPTHAPTSAWWTQFGSTDLGGLVAEAMAGNPGLAAAGQRLAAARLILQAQTGATTWPSLDAGAQAVRQRTLTVPVALPRFPQTALYNTFVGEAQVHYTFDIFGAVRHHNQALADRVDQQSDELRAARDALQANVVSAALGISADAAQLQVLEAVEKALRQNERDAQRQQALGAVPGTTALDARLQAETLATQIPALRSRMQARRHALAVLLGRTPDQAPPVIAFDQLRLPPTLPVLVPSALLQSRADIQAATAALRAAAQDVGASTAEMFPSLTLSVGMGRGGFDWSSLFSASDTLWSIAGGLTAPLFHGGALLAQRDAHLQAYAAAENDYRSTVLAAFKEVADTLSALDQGGAALSGANAAADAAQAIATETTRRAALGAVPLSSARTAQAQAGQARVTALDAQSKQLLTAVRLFHAMGTAGPP